MKTVNINNNPLEKLHQLLKSDNRDPSLLEPILEEISKLDKTDIDQGLLKNTISEILKISTAELNDKEAAIYKNTMTLLINEVEEISSFELAKDLIECIKRIELINPLNIFDSQGTTATIIEKYSANNIDKVGDFLSLDGVLHHKAFHTILKKMNESVTDKNIVEKIICSAAYYGDLDLLKLITEKSSVIPNCNYALSIAIQKKDDQVFDKLLDLMDNQYFEEKSSKIAYSEEYFVAEAVLFFNLHALEALCKKGYNYNQPQ